MFDRNILFFLFIFLCLLGCKKYQEDKEDLHLRTVKGRLAGGLFKKSKVWDYGVSSPYSYNIGFSKSGIFVGGFPPFLIREGKWELVDDKEKLRITDDNGNTAEYTIMKLDNNALWLQNDTALFTFKPHH